MFGATEPIKTIYFGTFIQCKSLQELEICHEGAIGVNEKGVIAFVDREAKDSESVATHHQWDGAKIVKAAPNQYFFPGFIGT